jgi:hypothetical protein
MYHIMIPPTKIIQEIILLSWIIQRISKPEMFGHKCISKPSCYAPRKNPSHPHTQWSDKSARTHSSSRLRSSRMWTYAVWKNITEISEEFAASIFRVDNEDGISKLIRNTGDNPPDGTVSSPRTPLSYIRCCNDLKPHTSLLHFFMHHLFPVFHLFVLVLHQIARATILVITVNCFLRSWGAKSPHSARYRWVPQ